MLAFAVIHTYILMQYCFFMLTSFIKSLRNCLSQVTWKTFVNFRNKCRYVWGVHTYMQLQYFVCLAVLIQIHTYVCMYELNMLTYNCVCVCVCVRVFKRSFPLSQSLSKVCTYKHTHVCTYIHLVKVVYEYTVDCVLYSVCTVCATLFQISISFCCIFVDITFGFTCFLLFHISSFSYLIRTIRK